MKKQMLNSLSVYNSFFFNSNVCRAQYLNSKVQWRFVANFILNKQNWKLEESLEATGPWRGPTFWPLLELGELRHSELKGKQKITALLTLICIKKSSSMA